MQFAGVQMDDVPDDWHDVEPLPPAPPAAQPEAPELTEDGLARAFTARHGARLRFDHTVGVWFHWTGTHWRRDRSGLVQQLVRELIRSRSAGSEGKTFVVSRKVATARGVEAFARTDRLHAMTGDEWDLDPWLLGTPGGTVDLRTGEVQRPRPDDLITRTTAVAPAAEDRCHLWHRFLAEATGGDDELVQFLQRWIGYCLTGSTKEHALVFAHGSGGNGKGLFLNTVAAILGDYAATASMESLAATHGDRHPADIAALRGARLVVAQEVNEGRAWDEARVKALTGGDRITARHLYGHPFTFTPSFKFTIAGNSRPVLRSVDEAMRRRFLILPFNRKPATPDPDLMDKLRAEWPGILAWAITGAAEWQAGGLAPPEAVLEATAEYFEAQDLFGAWMAEETEADLHAATPARDLYASWKGYAEAAGIAPGSTTKLGERLGRAGLRRGWQRIGGKGVKTWCGIALRTGGL